MKSRSKKVVKKVTTKAKVVKKKLTTSSLIRTNVNMDKALHSKAKQVAAKENISLNKLINIAIKQHLK